MNRPSGTPEQYRDRASPRGRDDRDPAAVDQPAEHVAAKIVGAQPVRGRRPLQRLDQVLAQRIVGHDAVGEDGEQHEEDEHRRGAAGDDLRRRSGASAATGRSGSGSVGAAVTTGALWD